MGSMRRETRALRRTVGWGALLCVVVVVVTHHLLTERQCLSAPSKKSATKPSLLKAPVPQLPYVSKRSFYVMTTPKEGEALVRLDLTFTFLTINHLECFERNDVLFRDVAYRFLKHHQPSANTVKAWTPMVQDDLLTFFRAEVGICKVDKVTVESLQRL